MTAVVCAVTVQLWQIYLFIFIIVFTGWMFLLVLFTWVVVDKGP